jgi:hypothetical protein
MIEVWDEGRCVCRWQRTRASHHSSSPECQSQRARYPEDDARRVCEQLSDKVCSTKVERGFDLLTQLFTRYGRRMLAYEVVADEFGVVLVGQPDDG